jgi:hypothetical protein
MITTMFGGVAAAIDAAQGLKTSASVILRLVAKIV